MSLGPTAVPNVQVTGKVLPGIAKTGQPPRKAESLSVSKVADITTTFRGKDRPLVDLAGSENIFFNKPRRISCIRWEHLVKLGVEIDIKKIDMYASDSTVHKSYRCMTLGQWPVVTHRVEAAFMHFIQDYNTVLRKYRVCQDFPEQTAVRHVLHHSVLVQNMIFTF